MKFYRKLKELMLKHDATTFVVTFLATFVFVRVTPYIYNANPIFLGIELHHFDYGLLLLIILASLTLMRRKMYPLYIPLTAIAIALVLDDLWFIRKNIVDPNINELEAYSATLPVTLIFIFTIAVIVAVIGRVKRHNHLSGRKDTHWR